MQCELPENPSSPDEIRGILENYRVIAVVGLSPKPDRPSHRVSAYMQEQGYRIIPVHPIAEEILGEKAWPSLEAIPAEEGVEIVNLFRPPDKVPPHVEEAIRIKAKVVWMQEGIVNNEAAKRAKEAGLEVVQGRCLLKEHKLL
ncbi:MAG: CoA-binding protein [Candidatus Krumholzibacteria bacterium]|jgi:hypothetical protein|nr:CoA-binding protein [Candidatus Krumholzibacteria bacterium]MDP6668388.1 CoA-binding protein [Candidatus Krumholzibacteria bacterium]MDP6797436.1 CoA-binding protein [Candidatus Krumholzibacteria bacterium]MDP7022159.1 CoA-binding protein [Candidatus Krumholzibacteria bacterium]